MKRIWTFLGISLVLVLVGCTKNNEPKDTLFVSGRIDGDTVDISSKIAGKIVEITAREGDQVQAGQLLARISSPQDEAQLEALKADVAAAEGRLAEAEAAAPARVEVADANVAVSQANVAASQASVATSQANVAASQAELMRWQAELEQAQLDAKRDPPWSRQGRPRRRRLTSTEPRRRSLWHPPTRAASR